MKKLVVATTVSSLLCAVLMCVVSIFSTFFDNFSCAFEKTIETGDPSYLQNLGTETEANIKASVNSLPFMGTIKKSLSNQGVDEKYLNEVNGQKDFVNIRKPDMDVINMITDELGIKRIPKETIDKIYNEKLLTDKQYSSIAEDVELNALEEAVINKVENISKEDIENAYNKIQKNIKTNDYESVMDPVF